MNLAFDIYLLFDINLKNYLEGEGEGVGKGEGG
jgi:hypothetical protein